MSSTDWPSVPGYDLKEEIGAGGFGLVFLAEEQSLLRKRRAIKICWPSPLQASEGVQERFVRESKTLSELNHPNIVSYVNSGFTEEAPPKPFVVMEYIEGVNLTKYPTQSIEKVCLIALSLLETLEYCHSRGVIHRDIKPSNIIVRPTADAPVLVDFGLSIGLVLIGERISTAASGSPGYMAPELVENPLLVDTRLDIYSMGVLFYELIAGQRPDPLMPRSLKDFREEADIHLDEIVRGCLTNINQRVPSAKVLRERLFSWLEIHRRHVSHIGQLSSRAQALRKGFVDSRQKNQKNQESASRHSAERKRLSAQRIDELARQTLILFEEAVSSLSEELPGIVLEKGSALHSSLASTLIAEQSKPKEVLDLVTIAANDKKLIFSVLFVDKLIHPWTGEVLFSSGKAKGMNMSSVHRNGIPSSRVMQPLFMVRSQVQGNENSEATWLHLALLMVFDESAVDDVSAPVFVIDHHPKFTKIENRLVVSSSMEEIQNAIWSVVEWFVNTELATDS